MMPAVKTVLLGPLVALVLLTTLLACDDRSSPDLEANGAGPSLCSEKSPKGLCIIRLGVAGVSPVRFEADIANMQQLPDGSVQIRNDLILVAPEIRWTLTEASVTFKRAAGGSFDRIEGEARVPFDQVPILKKAKTGGGVMAALGYDSGKNLSDLDAPLNADTHYLFFAFKENFSVSFGFSDLGIPVRGGEAASKPFSFSPIPEAKLVMALDVTDPFFYVSAKGLSPKKKKKKDGDHEQDDPSGDDDDGKDKKKKPSLNIGGFGYSYHGRIPESVSTPDFNKTMTGNLVLEGSIPFPPAPVIQYTGYYLVRQDATLQAISGDVTLGFPLKLLTSFSVSLGNATAIAEVEGDRADIFMAGRYQPDTSWVPAIIPVFPEEDVQLAVRLDTGNKTNNFIHGKGSYALAGSAFAPEGLRFGKIFSKQGEFRITLEQIEMSGGVDSDLSPFKFGAGTHFDALVALDKQNNRLGIDGNILIGAFHTKGKLLATPAAVTLTANLNGPSEWQMALQGKLHEVNQDLMLSGQFEVPDYLNARLAKTVMQTVEHTKQNLNQQINQFAQQLESLKGDLPSVRKAAKEGAQLALWNMDTNHEKAIVNQEIASFCKGKLIPGCTTGGKWAYNSSDRVKHVKAQLNSVIAVLNKNDDRSTREALKATLREIIKSNPVKVDLKVYSFKVAYLDKDREAKLQKAISLIDKLKTTGGKKIDARRQLDEFTKSTLNQIAQDIEKGATPIKVKSMGFDMPASHSGSIDLAIVLTLQGNPTDKTLTARFDPKQPEQLPMAIIKKLSEQ